METKDSQKETDMCITDGNHCTQRSQCCSKYCVVVGLANQLCMSISDPNKPKVGNTPYSVTSTPKKSETKCLSTGYFCFANNECCSELCVSIGYHSIKACVNSTVTVDTSVKNSFDSTIIILNSTLDYCTPNSYNCDDLSQCCEKICAPIGFTGIKLCMYLPINKSWTMYSPSSSVTSKPNQNSNFCVLNGHYCVEDYDCCSKKCYSMRNTKLHACIV
ncbi:uncharacterized protein LOC103579605 isoform X2 [Microplitis demolitor]|nr:uncharacterized protein LOC103579605 isoform X2 [Microplitis demolitor]